MSSNVTLANWFCSGIVVVINCFYVSQIPDLSLCHKITELYSPLCAVHTIKAPKEGWTLKVSSNIMLNRLKKGINTKIKET